MNQPVFTDRAPAAIGPYSQAIVSGSFVYTSGQLGFDPVSGRLAEGVEAQARAAFTNLREVLAAAGAQMTDVVKTTVFLKNMYDFGAMNAIYAEFFSEPYPARSAIEVAGLPKNGLVEIEAVAIKK